MPRHLKSFAALVLTAELCSALPLHAAPSYVTNPIPVRVTHVPEWFRPTTSRLCFSALSVTTGYSPPASYGLDDPPPLRSQLLPVASWTLPAGSSELPANVALVTKGKLLTPGDYILECWLDIDGNGKFEPGEPYGCERMYGLGTTNKLSLTAIELMEVSPSIARMDISSLIAAMPDTTDSPPGLSTLSTTTDRGIWSVPFASVTNATTCGTNKPPSTSQIVRVRVVREKINNATQRVNAVSFAETVLDSYFDLSLRNVMTEADMLATDVLDLNWGTNNKIYNGSNTPSPFLSNTTYRIVVGNSDVGSSANHGNNLPVCFINEFERKERPPPVVPSPYISHDYTGRPVFTWAHTNSLDKPYPAFVIRIYTSSNPSSSSFAYESPALRAPARNERGLYEFISPVCAGMTVTSTPSSGVGTLPTNTTTFVANSTYWWGVCMCDAKFFGYFTDTTLTPFVMPPATNSVPLSP